MRTALLLLITGAPNPVRIADPSPVHLIRRAGQLPEPWYRTQVDLWQQHLEAHPQDARGWYSLYLATLYGADPDSESRLQSILDSMGRHVADSWELPYLEARAQSDHAGKITLLESALARCPDCGEMLEDLAMERELTLDDTRHLWRQLYQSGTVAQDSGDTHLIEPVRDESMRL